MPNFRLPQRSRWELQASGSLVIAYWQFLTDVSGQPIGPEMSRNCPYSVRNIPEERRSLQVFFFERYFTVVNREFRLICAQKANSVLYCPLFLFGLKQTEMCWQILIKSFIFKYHGSSFLGASLVTEARVRGRTDRQMELKCAVLKFPYQMLCKNISPFKSSSHDLAKITARKGSELCRGLSCYRLVMIRNLLSVRLHTDICYNLKQQFTHTSS